MRAQTPAAIALVALLVLAGCTGLQNSAGTDPAPDVSPAEFPNASAIDQSVFDGHARALANTSFTLRFGKNRTDRVFRPSEQDVTHMNDSARIVVEPAASQYLAHTTGYFSGNGTTYANGRTLYRLPEGSTDPTVRSLSPVSVFNESSERYLWGSWFGNDSGNQLEHAAIAATFQREGVETFSGVPVMRYEATGVEALSASWAGGENASSTYEAFDATLLLDRDGVIHHYAFEFVWSEYRTRRIATEYTLSGVGSTDVDRPDWVRNATAGS